MTIKTDKPKTLDSFLRRPEVDQSYTVEWKELTIAQSIRRSSNPYLAAVTANVLREVKNSEGHLHDKKVFYFEDKSFLVFEVAYTAVEDGTDSRSDYRNLP